MQSVITDSMELYKQYADNPSFRAWLMDVIFKGTYRRGETGFETKSRLRAG
jgi:type I restriction enzyme R subunit